MRKLREFIALAGLIGTFVFVAINYHALPQSIPTHFDDAGNINGWSSKHGLLLIPVIALAVYVGLGLVRRIPPHRMNLPVPASERERCIPIAIEMMEWMRAVIMGMMVFVCWMEIRSAYGAAPSLLTTMLLPVPILGVALFFIWWMMKLPQ